MTKCDWVELPPILAGHPDRPRPRGIPVLGMVENIGITLECSICGKIVKLHEDEIPTCGKVKENGC